MLVHPIHGAIGQIRRRMATPRGNNLSSSQCLCSNACRQPIAVAAAATQSFENRRAGMFCAAMFYDAAQRGTHMRSIYALPEAAEPIKRPIILKATGSPGSHSASSKQCESDKTT